MNKRAQYLAISSGKFDREKEYWQNQLSGDFAITAFPSDKKPILGDLTGGRGIKEFHIPPITAHQLVELSNKSDKRLLMALLTAVITLLYRYTAESDLVIFTPVERHANDQEYLNTGLILRTKLNSGMTFKELLLTVKDTLLAGEKNQNFPYNLCCEMMGLEPAALLPTGAYLENLQEKAHVSEAGCQMIFGFRRAGASIAGVIDYAAELYEPEAIMLIIQHLLNLLESALTNLEGCLTDLNLLSAEERKRLIVEFNDTTTEYPEKKTTIVQFYQAHAERQPEKAAIVMGDVSLTYHEFNVRANQLARHLRARGVSPEVLVAIIVERSMELLIGLFAILKAGGAYLPIDPLSPEARIHYTLEDSGAKLVLTQSKFAATIPGKDCLDLNEPTLYTGSGENLAPLNTPQHLAYVIYTSGSTGKPKGVMIEHSSMVNALQLHQQIYPISPEDTYLFFTSYTFDASVLELFGWVIGGARLCILERQVEKDPRLVLQAIIKYGISHANFVPSMLNMFLYELNDEELSLLNQLKFLYVGGEVLAPEIALKFTSKVAEVRMINVYGPTEATIDATQFEVRDIHTYRTVPIGKPIPNVRIYILDEKQRLQPTGVPGEICIAGVGVGRGYLNRSELTAEKFIVNPFDPTERIYRSGDLGRWLSDGNLEFLGRIDQQVKIRGFRIELGEIENQLKQHAAIKEAVVISKQANDGSSYLTAYIVSTVELSLQDLRTYLMQFLPEYMVPAYFFTLPALPLLPSGKIDRKALSDIEGKLAASVEYIAPRSELERKLAEVWKEILQVERVGINDSFFQLGGNSVSIVRLYERIKEIVDCDATVADLFSYHTIAMFAEFINAKKAAPDGTDTFTDLFTQLRGDLTPEEAAHLFMRGD